MTRVLVIEDNTDLAFGVQTTLEIEGYDVSVAEDGKAGLAVVRDTNPDLIVLDLMIPELNGYQVLKAVRDDGNQVPVLILTARGEEADKVHGFNVGADDYVTKPFSNLELLARVRALLRRGGQSSADPARVQHFGSIQVNVASRAVYKAGKLISLAPKEFDLLVSLLERNGAVASRVELLRELWDYNASIMTRTVDMHIAELRRKLEDDPAKPRHILTVRKIGYRLEP